MNLHLFSTPGSPSIKYIVVASQPYLAATDHPVVLYLPAAADKLKPRHVVRVNEAFENLARVEVLDLTQSHTINHLITTINEATVLYIPGGNTYQLLWRIQQADIFDSIIRRVQASMPVVGFSAGALICGENILTSTARNFCKGTDFSGFGFTRYNFSAHYPNTESEKRNKRDAKIIKYHTIHTNPVLALENDAGVTINNDGAWVDFGHCWLFEPGEDKRLLPVGKIE